MKRLLVKGVFVVVMSLETLCKPLDEVLGRLGAPNLQDDVLVGSRSLNAYKYSPNEKLGVSLQTVSETGSSDASASCIAPRLRNAPLADLELNSWVSHGERGPTSEPMSWTRPNPDASPCGEAYPFIQGLPDMVPFTIMPGYTRMVPCRWQQTIEEVLVEDQEHRHNPVSIDGKGVMVPEPVLVHNPQLGILYTPIPIYPPISYILRQRQAERVNHIGDQNSEKKYEEAINFQTREEIASDGSALGDCLQSFSPRPSASQSQSLKQEAKLGANSSLRNLHNQRFQVAKASHKQEARVIGKKIELKLTDDTEFPKLNEAYCPNKKPFLDDLVLDKSTESNSQLDISEVTPCSSQSASKLQGDSTTQEVQMEAHKLGVGGLVSGSPKLERTDLSQTMDGLRQSEAYSRYYHSGKQKAPQPSSPISGPAEVTPRPQPMSTSTSSKRDRKKTPTVVPPKTRDGGRRCAVGQAPISSSSKGPSNPSPQSSINNEAAKLDSNGKSIKTDLISEFPQGITPTETESTQKMRIDVSSDAKNSKLNKIGLMPVEEFGSSPSSHKIKTSLPKGTFDTYQHSHSAQVRSETWAHHAEAGHSAFADHMFDGTTWDLAGKIRKATEPTNIPLEGQGSSSNSVHAPIDPKRLTLSKCDEDARMVSDEGEPQSVPSWPPKGSHELRKDSSSSRRSKESKTKARSRIERTQTTSEASETGLKSFLNPSYFSWLRLSDTPTQSTKRHFSRLMPKMTPVTVGCLTESASQKLTRFWGFMKGKELKRGVKNFMGRLRSRITDSQTSETKELISREISSKLRFIINLSYSSSLRLLALATQVTKENLTSLMPQLTSAVVGNLHASSAQKLTIFRNLVTGKKLKRGVKNFIGRLRSHLKNLKTREPISSETLSKIGKYDSQMTQENTRETVPTPKGFAGKHSIPIDTTDEFTQWCGFKKELWVKQDLNPDIMKRMGYILKAYINPGRQATYEEIEYLSPSEYTFLDSYIRAHPRDYKKMKKWFSSNLGERVGTKRLNILEAQMGQYRIISEWPDFKKGLRGKFSSMSTELLEEFERYFRMGERWPIFSHGPCGFDKKLWASSNRFRSQNAGLETIFGPLMNSTQRRHRRVLIELMLERQNPYIWWNEAELKRLCATQGWHPYFAIQLGDALQYGPSHFQAPLFGERPHISTSCLYSLYSIVFSCQGDNRSLASSSKKEGINWKTSAQRAWLRSLKFNGKSIYDERLRALADAIEDYPHKEALKYFDGLPNHFNKGLLTKKGYWHFGHLILWLDSDLNPEIMIRVWKKSGLQNLGNLNATPGTLIQETIRKHFDYIDSSTEAAIVEWFEIESRRVKPTRTKRFLAKVKGIPDRLSTLVYWIWKKKPWAPQVIYIDDDWTTKKKK